MTTTNLRHRQAIANLNFCHEHLPTAHEGAGSWFVHTTEYANEQAPTVRVVIDSEATTIFAFDNGIHDWTAKFDASTPDNVINQAVAAAMAAISF